MSLYGFRIIPDNKKSKFLVLRSCPCRAGETQVRCADFERFKNPKICEIAYFGLQKNYKEFQGVTMGIWETSFLAILFNFKIFHLSYVDHDQWKAILRLEE